MSERDFTVTDTSTWPITLTAEQVSAIYQRSVAGIKRAVQLGKFVPIPFETRPKYLWRRADIERHVIGARGFSSIKRVG